MTTPAQEITKLRSEISATHQHGVQVAGEISRLQRLERALIAVNARRRRQLARLLAPSQPKRVQLPGVDYAWGGPISGAYLQAQGYRFAARYLSPDPSKNLTRAELHDHSRHGIASVAVWEATADRAAQGAAAGRQDAVAAHAELLALGAPTAPVYFAVDFPDPDPRIVVPYFAGARQVLGLPRVGVYGGLDTVRALLNLRLVSRAWQTYAWSAGVWDDRAVLRQVRNGINVAGVDSDLDTAVWSDFGGFAVR